MVVMSNAVYERIITQNEIYHKLAEAERLCGEQLLDGNEVLKELRGRYGRE